jgi:hypothetical protein
MARASFTRMEGPFSHTWMLVGSIASAITMLGIMLYFSGWRKIHRHYGPVIGSFPPGRHMLSGRIGWLSYNNVLTVATDPAGLYLKVFLLFRPGHPPLFIPWGEFHGIDHTKVLFSTTVRAVVGHPKITTITLPARAVRGTILDPEVIVGLGSRVN